MNLMINSLWETCPPEYSMAGHLAEVATTLVGINTFFCLLGIFANVLACFALFSTDNKNLSFHYFVSSLAAADLIMTLIAQPLLDVIILGQMNGKCIPALQLIFRAVSNLGWTASLFTITLIALDRCLFLTGLMNYTNTMTSGKKIALAVLWLTSCVISALRVFNIIFAAADAAVLLFVLCTCYTIVYYQFREQRKRLLTTSRDNKAPAAKDIRAETGHKIIATPGWMILCTIVMILFSFILGWLPLFCYNVAHPRKHYGVQYYTMAIPLFMSSVLNPIIYCFTNYNYRQSLKRVLSRFCFLAPKKRKNKLKESTNTRNARREVEPSPA